MNYIQTQTPTTTETNHNNNHTLPLPGRKPSKLQLQVPEHAGGPVRLATPPRVLINGNENNPRQQNSHTHQHERRSSADFFNQIDEGSEEDDDVNVGVGIVGGGGGVGGAGGVGGEGGDEGEGGGGGGGVDWKKRALYLKRKLIEKEEELKALKRRVLDAVM